MATITLSIASTNKTFTVSGADATRVLNALQARYVRSYPDGAQGRTPAQVFELWADETFANLNAVTKEEEGQVLIAAALAGVTDIVAT